MRLIAFIEYAAVIAGILGMIAGNFFGLSKGVQFGVFLLGAGIGLGGLEALATRRLCFRTSDDGYEAYAGAPAVIVGLMCLLIGAAVLLAAYLLSEGLWPRTVSYLTRRPGPLLGGAGAVVLGLGVLMVLNPTGRSGWAWRLLVYFPRASLGLLVTATGAALICLGIWESADPAAFQDFLRRMPRNFDWPVRL